MTKFEPKQFIQCRAVKPSDVDVENRTVKIIASDETPVERFSWERWEPYTLIVSHKPEHVKLDRVNSGVCLFFDGHPGSFFSNSSRIGKVKQAEIIDKQLILTVKLNRSEKADQYLKDVEDDVEPGNSIGFVVNTLEVISKAEYKEDKFGDKELVKPAVMKAIDWELHEVSAVDIPANPNAGKYTKDEKQNFELIEKYPIEIIGLEDMADRDKSSESTEPKADNSNQLATENQDLKTKLNKVTLESNYWKLRNQALELWAVKNCLTKEEFNLDFSDDHQTDLNRFSEMTAEDAMIEFRTIARTLERASKKKPIDRLSATDQALLSNGKIDANDTRNGTTGHKSRIPGNQSVDQFAESIVQDI
jgi:hypothetical protein